MARDEKQIEETIDELENAWRPLRERARLFDEMRYSLSGYDHRLFNALDDTVMDERITSRVPVSGGHVLDHGIWQTAAILANPWSFHVPTRPDLSGRSEEQARVDKIEMWVAHYWGVKFSQNGAFRDQTHIGQAGDPIVFWWLEANEWKLPEDDDEAEEYRKNFDPFELKIKHYSTCAFLPDEIGIPTLAGIHEEIPYYEVVSRYGSKKPESRKHALEICSEEFPYLRGARGEGVGLEESDLSRCKAMVRILDDGETICHTIDLSLSKFARKGQKYQMKDGETEVSYPNYFGRVSLFPVTGRFNPSAEKIENRYMSLCDTLSRAQEQLDRQDTWMSSIAYTVKQATQALDKDVAIEAMERGSIPDIDKTDALVRSLLGTQGEMGPELHPAAQVIRERLLQDRNTMLPSPWLTVPDKTAAAYGQAAVGLSAVETSQKLYDGATQSEITQALAVTKAMTYYITHSGAMGGSKKGIDAKGQEKLTVYLRGDEPSQQNAQRYIGAHGRMLELNPDDFEDDVIEIKIKPSTEAQKQQEYTLAAAQAAAGYITPEQVLEKLTEDVTGQAKLLEAARLYQEQKPQFSRAALVAAVERINLKGRMDVSALFLPFLMPPTDDGQGGTQGAGGGHPPGPGGNGASPPRPPNSLISQNTVSPATNPSQAQARG